MSKWFAGGANKITLMRVPCMLIAAVGVFLVSLPDWYWIGFAAYITGLILDALDGFWARRVAKRPTMEGQFLDQFVDKVGFMYPMLAAATLAHGQSLPAWWLGQLAIMAFLDAISCLHHYRAYRHSRVNGFVPSFGAVSFGKMKFILQSCALSAMVAFSAPATGGLIARPLSVLGHLYLHFVPLLMAMAMALAMLSLLKRMQRRLVII